MTSMLWIPQSDDQFFYWDWSIRNGVPMTLDHNASGAALINGFSPASAELNRLVKTLKEQQQ